MTEPAGVADAESETLLDRTGVVVITYNHEEYIEDCLGSVLASDPGEVVVVDNGSTDGTVATVQREFPEVTVLQPADNVGYGAASNRGVERLEREFVVVLNPDTRLAPDCLAELLAPLSESDRRITVPKILTYDGAKINTVGNLVHPTGLAFTRGYEDPPDAYAEPGRLSGLSGACLATRRETYQALGGFEEAIFVYMEDTELSWRAGALGIDIRYVPTAVVFHDYPGVEVDAEKLYHLERGRYIILRKYLDRRTAVVLAPSLLLTELLTWGYAVSRGLAGVRRKLRAIREGLSADVEPVGPGRQAPIDQFDARLPVDQLHPSPAVRRALGVVNEVYEANHSLLGR